MSSLVICIKWPPRGAFWTKFFSNLIFPTWLLLEMTAEWGPKFNLFRQRISLPEHASPYLLLASMSSCAQVDRLSHAPELGRSTRKLSFRIFVLSGQQGGAGDLPAIFGDPPKISSRGRLTVSS
jgi:hypothetical protein